MKTAQRVLQAVLPNGGNFPCYRDIFNFRENQTGGLFSLGRKQNHFRDLTDLAWPPLQQKPCLRYFTAHRGRQILKNFKILF